MENPSLWNENKDKKHNARIGSYKWNVQAIVTSAKIGDKYQEKRLKVKSHIILVITTGTCIMSGQKINKMIFLYESRWNSSDVDTQPPCDFIYEWTELFSDNANENIILLRNSLFIKFVYACYGYINIYEILKDTLLLIQKFTFLLFYLNSNCPCCDSSPYPVLTRLRTELANQSKYNVA